MYVNNRNAVTQRETALYTRELLAEEELIKYA